MDGNELSVSGYVLLGDDCMLLRDGRLHLEVGSYAADEHHALVVTSVVAHGRVI